MQILISSSLYKVVEFSFYTIALFYFYDEHTWINLHNVLRKIEKCSHMITLFIIKSNLIISLSMKILCTKQIPLLSPFLITKIL